MKYEKPESEAKEVKICFLVDQSDGSTYITQLASQVEPLKREVR